jgi:cell wall assembly regulator SMI1
MPTTSIAGAVLGADSPLMALSASALWARYKAALAERKIPHVSSLLGGAEPGMLAAAEDEFGCKLPDDVRQVFLANNGQRGSTGIVFFLNFMSIQLVRREWEHHREYETKYPDRIAERAREGRSGPAGAIQAGCFRKGWIPLYTALDNNYLGLDLDPGPAGTAGQIINFGRDEREQFVIATSFKELLAFLVHLVERGHFVLEPADPDAKDRDPADPEDWSFLVEPETSLPGALRAMRDDPARFR